MKTRWTFRTALAIAALTTLLAGCTINIYHHGDMHHGKADPARPQVQVVAGKISVQPDPIVFTKDQVNVTVTWQLPPGGKYTFPENGIVFEKSAGDEVVNCRRGERPNEFSCLNRHTRPGVYKYDVRVLEDGKALDPLDPHMVDL